jgi:hypothetical protein
MIGRAPRDVLTRITDFVPVAVLAGVIAALAVHTHLVHPSDSSEDAWVAWACLIAVAFYGWGSGVDRLTATDGRFASAPLRAAWGLATVVLLGGVLNALHLCTASALCVVVMAGLALALVEVAPIGDRRPRVIVLRWLRAMRCMPGLLVAQLALVSTVMGRLYASLHFVSGGYRWDDAPAYLVFVEQLAQTGSCAQPYSLRRLSALGGETVLQGLLFADRSDAAFHIHLFDWGLCGGLVALLLAAGPEARRRGKPWFRYVAAAIALASFIAVWNAGAVFAGVLCFVALWMTVSRLPQPGSVAPLQLVPVGLVAAATCTLRTNYVPAAAAFVVLAYLAHMLSRSPRRPWRARIDEGRELLLVGAATLAFLSPWMIDSLHYFATPLFPLLQGNAGEAAAGGLASPAVADERAATFTMSVITTWPFALPAMALFFLAGVFAPSRTVRALMVATAFAVAIQLRKLPLINPFGHSRYLFAYALAAVVAVTASAAEAWRGGALARRRAAWFPAAVAAASAIGVYQTKDDIVAHYAKDVEAVTAPDPGDMGERAMQRSIPAGAAVMTFLDEPYRLDFRRNPIFLGDFPGAVGPGGGIPVRSGADAVARYLLGHQIRYVAFIRPDFSRGIYGRRDQQRNAVNEDKDWISQRQQAPYSLALFDDLDALAAAHKRLFDANGLVVLDLGW